MSIDEGHTFAATEQVTNTKLNNLVSNATISLEFNEIANNMLTSLASAAGQIRSYNLIASLASGNLFRYDGTNGLYGASS